MTYDRFNELLRGPLAHPIPVFSVSRLAMALFAVLEATGPAGDQALEDWCAARQLQDEDDGDGDAFIDGTGP